MQFPSLPTIIHLHQLVLERSEGTPGILNLGAVDSALYRTQWGPFFGIPRLADRAALLLRGLCQDHPFADGNKRTSFAATALFVALNGHNLIATADETIAFMLAVAQDQVNLDDMADWLDTHLQKSELPGGGNA